MPVRHNQTLEEDTDLVENVFNWGPFSWKKNGKYKTGDEREYSILVEKNNHNSFLET